LGGAGQGKTRGGKGGVKKKKKGQPTQKKSIKRGKSDNCLQKKKKKKGLVMVFLKKGVPKWAKNSKASQKLMER